MFRRKKEKPEQDEWSKGLGTIPRALQVETGVYQSLLDLHQLTTLTHTRSTGSHLVQQPHVQHLVKGHLEAPSFSPLQNNYRKKKTTERKDKKKHVLKILYVPLFPSGLHLIKLDVLLCGNCQNVWPGSQPEEN
ncbi:ferritin heavy chain-like isoform X2 [Narcine bancroftii]|uniref:ferritin heavy chain-like isoform X2 n=1 Tax=Narcine bancroftii TaxID=1343680 RepID=UPI00383213C5